MIVEGIVTTLNAGDELNIAPMGPIVDESEGLSSVTTAHCFWMKWETCR